MSKVTFITTALRLPHKNFEALVQGRTVAAIPQTFLSVGQQFALCSQKFDLDSEGIEVKVWARCDHCQAFNNSYTLDELSQITAWSVDELKQLFEEKTSMFLAYLKVYRLTNPIKVSLKFNSQFAPLPEPLNVTEFSPILRDEIFNQRKKSPLLQATVLEELQAELLHLTVSNPKARYLEESIEAFLQGTDTSLNNKFITISPDLDWIKTIVSLGNRSKKLDEGKSNYQAGTDFENIVRQGLSFLGFTIDPICKGGAGGLDLFCSDPYPLVGECKAGKRIPSSTAEQLNKLGIMRLSREQFDSASKIIIGPGDPTPDLLTAAKKYPISIINPMSLQRLVELKAQYPGSIDLFELKKYLEPGCIDSKIDEYIQKVLNSIKLRSEIVQAVKELTKPDQKQLQVVEVKTCYNVKFADSNNQLNDQAVHELLIELSSPFAGYLGRVEGIGMTSDRFYFLRDLPQPEID